MPNTYNIGPGKFNTHGTPFLLSKPEWLSVQCYVTSALHLPTDQSSLKKLLPVDPPGGIDQFKDLVNAYKNIYDHCTYWQDHTLPDSVNCAADIVHYNQKVPSYYGALTKLIPRLDQQPPDEMAIKQFQSILQNLSSQTKGYADHANLVAQGMKNFAEESAQDQSTINPLVDKYKKQLGTEGPNLIQLANDLQKDKDELKKWQDEYEHDVIVAATSPTYAWIFPVGTISAGVVAGIYGKKATDSLKRVHEYQTKIDLLAKELQSATIMLLDLQRIQSDLGDISVKLAIALPVIEKMQGAWLAIHSDLEHILKIIEEDIKQVPAIIKSLGIEEAIQAWDTVAKEADAYRVNAYITFTSEEEAKKIGKSIQKTA